MRIILVIFTIHVCISIFGNSVAAQEKKYEISGVVNREYVQTDRYDDFKEFGGIPAAQIPANFQASLSELKVGFKEAFGRSSTLPGISISGAYYFRKNIAVVSNFNFSTKKSYRGMPNNPIFFEDNNETERRNLSLLGGLQWKFRKKRFEPFARAMAGFSSARNRMKLSVANTESFTFRHDFWAFALSLGGGVDIRLNRTIALRLVQFDYIPQKPVSTTSDLTAPSGASRTDLGSTVLSKSFRNNFRVGSGLVFNF